MKFYHGTSRRWWNETPHHEELIVEVTQVILQELSLT